MTNTPKNPSGRSQEHSPLEQPEHIIRVQNHLIQLGREKGFITYDDVLAVLPEVEDNITELEDIFATLFINGIAVGQPVDPEEEDNEEEEEIDLVMEEELLALTEREGQIRVVALRPDGTQHFLSSFHQFCLITQELVALGEAIEELEDLLNKHSAKERDFQSFFEKHPDLILNDEYRRAHPHLTLMHDDGPLIPDFLLEPLDRNGLSDILDLKLPTTNIFVLKKSRMRFSAAVVEACAQLREYSGYFDEQQNRDLVYQTYGLKLYKPKMIVIIGRRGNVDPITFQKIKSDIPNLQLRTYDDVLDRAKARLRRR